MPQKTTLWKASAGSNGSMKARVLGVCGPQAEIPCMLCVVAPYLNKCKPYTPLGLYGLQVAAILFSG